MPNALSQFSLPPHAARHAAGGSDEINATGLVGAGAGGMNFVDRGDPSAEDFTLASFTRDGAWHDLNLSGIIPANATWACLKVVLGTTVGTGYIQVRKKGKANAVAVALVSVGTVAVYENDQVMVALDANRVIQYYVNAGSTWAAISIAVIGWLLPAA